VWIVENAQIEEKTWSPKDFGLQEHPIEACAGTCRFKVVLIKIYRGFACEISHRKLFIEKKKIKLLVVRE